MRDALIDLDVDISPSLVTSSMRADSYLTVLDYRGEMVSINQMKLISLITTQVIADRADMIGQADIVVCDCNLPADTIEAIARLPRQGIFIVDGVSGTKVLKIRDILKHIDVLKLAFVAMTLTGLADVTAALSVMQTLYKMDIKQTLLSLGGDGFMINDGADIHHFTALEEALLPPLVLVIVLAGYVLVLPRYALTLAGQYGRMSAYLSANH